MKTVIYNDHYYDIFLFSFIPKERASFLSLRSVGWCHDLIYSLVHQAIYPIVNNKSGCLMPAKLQNDNWGLPSDPLAKILHFQCRGPGLIPGWGIRSHMLQTKFTCSKEG